jgi:ribose transport system substrate-binding protein
MKRVFVMISVLLCAALLFAACSGGTPAATESAAASAAPVSEAAPASSEAPAAQAGGEGISITLLNASNGNAWRAQMEQEMNGLVEDYKAQGIISDYVAYSANDDATTQSQQLNQITSAGTTDVVIINPVSATSLNPAIDKAVAAGIKVLGVDSVIGHPDVVTLSNNQAEWAGIQAEFLAEKLGGKGKIVIYNAIAGYPASDIREKAYDEVLAKYPDIEVLKKVYHNWDEGEAKKLTATMISAYPEIDGILNQECSPGIMQAFEEAGVDMPKVICSDETVTYLNMWNDYNLANSDKAFEGIIVGNPPGIGVSAIKVAVQLMNGKEFKDGLLQDVDGGKALMLTPGPVITNENREKYVADTKGMPDSYTFSAVLSDDEVAAFFK